MKKWNFIEIWDLVNQDLFIILEDLISFQVEQGEIFGLVGESGSGKSTVVQALIRTLPPPAVITGGEVIIDKIDVLSLSAIEVKGIC